MTKKRIIILGGGFAGVKCAQTLTNALPASSTEFVLFNIENHIVFTPLLADVIGATVNPLDVVVPLRQLLPGVQCRTEEVTDIHVARSEIEHVDGDGVHHRLAYDHLVLSCGNIADLNSTTGMVEHAFPVKNIADALALRSQILEQMEKAESCQDADRRKLLLSFVIVGGGFSGVEVAGEINDLVKSSARFFQNFRAEDVSVMLIHGRDQILPEVSPRLREFARRRMERAGIKILLNSRVVAASKDAVELEGGSSVRGGTIVCTIGSSPAPILSRLNTAREKGRIVTEPDMRVQGATNIWAVGDCARVVNAWNRLPSPPTGQFAERQGRQCALNIMRTLYGMPARPFYFAPLGQLCSIGGHSGVAEVVGLRVSGFLAWLLWRCVYLFKSPTWARRIHIAFDWTLQLAIPRNLAHLRGDRINPNRKFRHPREIRTALRETQLNSI
jgi:NADH dehydrogenase